MGMMNCLFQFIYTFLFSLLDRGDAACRLRTSLCLQFKPHHIAAGAIFLAAKFLKVKLPSDGEKVWWQEFDVTPRQLEGFSLSLKPITDEYDNKTLFLVTVMCLCACFVFSKLAFFLHPLLSLS